ncbi:MAG: hypothetical protein M1834_005969 [Cirrosporium novae-zelandiae]|nr:MAG: hypothetical protein M1834_005969 [Cirrosporium novae-zelandiae]
MATSSDDVENLEHEEVDSAIDDLDSYTEWSETGTLESSAMDYRIVNGRSYHAYRAGRYDLPNDKAEQERLNLQHLLWVETLGGKLHAAPIPDDVQDVLDIATGTGKWAIDFADIHPSARVIGVDLSPIQPVWVPPNCMFEVDDAEADWMYHHNFDFIHGRTLTIGWRDWTRLSEQAFDYLNPGGWVEYEEFTFPTTCDCPPNTHPLAPVTEYLQYVVDASSKKGVVMQTPATLSARLSQAGFINIHSKEYRWYISNPKFKADLLHGIEAVAFKMLTEQLGWSTEEVLVYCAGVRRWVAEQTEEHDYLPIWVVYGQKPLNTGIKEDFEN